MAVGVPENDVFAAADAVLARGERPTVERVRLELGRGSPARVGALLDQWWEQLAGRLRGETRLPGLPTEVAQAFVAVWQQATTLAQGVAEQALAAQRQVLADEREALAALEARARLEAAQARQQTAEALAAHQNAETRMVDLEQLLTERQAQIDDLRKQREELLGQRDDARAQLIEVRQHLQDSRDKVEQVREEQQRYTRDVEDRAYREIDRAREESRALTVQLKQATTRDQALQRALLAVQAEQAEAREQRGIAQARSEALQREHDHAIQALATASQQHQLKHRELADAREQAAALGARAELLSQQLAEATAGPGAGERSRASNKSTRRK
ncbi:DNA-binding protein [Pseudomonas sp. GD03860]|uniref:DNA-binding protein n=1 Tax=Pseudomonas TaxID=286 RepID=UPI00236457A6|nr:MULTISPECIES: DNA-binding protein [Pseudomonas]MDD2058444.1 DNA-binding protein [Pseudomonas putida]MDH0640874.1 DNA-binding protein [Pseudomonas sp. GD03860]